MKILYIFYQYPPYNGGSYFQEFLNAVCKKIAQVGLISYCHPKTKFTKPKNLNIYWLKKLKWDFLNEPLFIASCLLKVIKVKDFKNYNLINCIGPRGLLAGWYLQKKSNLPLICTIEMLNKKGGLKNTIIYYLSQVLLTKIPIDKYICWSNYYKKYLLDWGIPDSKIIIIPPGIDTTKYHPNIDGKAIKNKYSPENPLLVFAKPLYLHHLKAVKLIIKTMSIIKSKTKINLLVGGGSGEKQIAAYAKKLKVLNRIEFMPPVPFSQIPKYLAAADIIVLPFSYQPTVSRSLLEALAMGKAIITNPAGEIKNLLSPEKQALLVTNNPQLMAIAVNKLINNKVLTKKLGQQARNLIVKNYKIDYIVNNHLYFYRQIT